MANTPLTFDDELARYRAGEDDYLDAPHCWDCSSALAEGEGVELDGRVRCGDCNHEEVEMRREEVTQVEATRLAGLEVQS